MPDAGPPKTGSRGDAGKAGDQDEPLTRKSLEWNTGWGWGGGGMEGSLAGRGEEMMGFVAMDGLILDGPASGGKGSKGTQIDEFVPHTLQVNLRIAD